MNVSRGIPKLPAEGAREHGTNAVGRAGGYARRTSRGVGNQINSLGTRLNAGSEGGKGCRRLTGAVLTMG